MRYKIYFVFAIIVSVTGTVLADACPAGYRYNPEYEKYTELEYIESTGTQWIDTGVMLGRNYINTNIKLEYTAKINPSNNWQVCGTIGESGIYIGVNASNTIYYGTGMKDTSTNIQNPSVVCKWINDAQNGNIKVTNLSTNVDVVNIQYTPVKKTTVLPIILFSYSTSQTVISYAKMFGQMYNAKVYNNNTIVRSFIPAKRNSDGAIGMYDLVNNVFYTNSGTGVFIAGPVVLGGALASQCLVCPPNTYKSTVGNDTQCTPCPSSYTSPSGSTDISDCGRILHLGDNNVMVLRATRQTTPSLHVRDNDGNEWYGNLYSKE